MTSLIHAGLVLVAASTISAQPVAAPNPGMSMLATENYSGALQYFQGQLQKDPKDAQAMADMAKLYLAQGKIEDGVKWAKQAAAQAPQNAGYQILLGDAYGYYVSHVSFFSKLGVAHKIRAAYQKAVQLSPDDADAQLSLAIYYIVAPGIAGGSDDKANKQIAILEKLNPVKAANAQVTLALSHKDIPKAEGILRDAAKLDNSGDTDYELGLLLMSQKKYADAIGVFEDGIRKAPDNSKNYYQVGHTAVLGKIHVQEGIGDLQKYLSMPHDWHPETPTYKWAHYRMGMLYGVAGDKASEKAQYQAALKIDPDFKQAKRALAAL